MLKLTNIKKDYYVGNQTISALKGVSLDFRKNEFVSVLGASGCGKTTLLNIIGGLDRYTDGELLIEGKSTKEFSDGEWDSYRNSTIGFVFQSYNLISHLTVLENVALALSLSGVSLVERNARSLSALEKLGIKEQANKRPNQLSGGQMQRVAIARAIVNNPKILLADEPTGALDSKTSVQIMEILKEISADKLVIMVTHNSHLAQKYSDRIIELHDGEVVSDSNPEQKEVVEVVSQKLKTKKTSMSFFTALKSSFRNLLTKKMRTILTAIAGSIGIIGIALVLSVSTGMNAYVAEQSDQFATIPISVSNYRIDMSTMQTMDRESSYPTEKLIYNYNMMKDFTLSQKLDATYLDYVKQLDSNLYDAISYTRGYTPKFILNKDDNAKLLATSSSGALSALTSSSPFKEIPEQTEYMQTQYDVLEGKFPTSANEIAIVVDADNKISNSTLQTLLCLNGVDANDEYPFEYFMNLQYGVVLNDAYYSFNPALMATGGSPIVATEKTQEQWNATFADDEQTFKLTVVGVLRNIQDSKTNILSTGIAYTPALSNYLFENAKTSNVVTSLNSLVATMPEGNDTMAEVISSLKKSVGADSTPTDISIYGKDFDSKEEIKVYLDNYNVGKEDADQVLYTDLASLISEALTRIIDIISWALIVFLSISLVVSSVMIGIITYVSVVERTKEIGILRAIGARKKDISRIFNAETLLLGFTAGLIGVLVAFLLTFPLNWIISALEPSIVGFAVLPIGGATILVLLSMTLTLIAGLIPSRLASKKDPVVALRTE